jgi:hypothetical protein
MVRITKVYTRGGDKGDTSLVGGKTVRIAGRTFHRLFGNSCLLDLANPGGKEDRFMVTLRIEES